MTGTRSGSLERGRARVGLLLGCQPSGESPCLERLLLETGRQRHTNARLLPVTVTWLAAYGHFVARYRLKRLVLDEIEPEFQAVLGLVVEQAVGHGATRDVLLVAKVCRPLPASRPLASVQCEFAALARVAERRASRASRRWGVWAWPVTLEADALRTVSWILRHNPGFRDRTVRKGDLRVSILETLRRDLPGHEASAESALARLSGATCTAVRTALRSPELEGLVDVGGERRTHRENPVRLRTAAGSAATD